MSQKELVGAIIVFESPDDLIAGIRRAREHGFTRIDSVSPHPIHMMDEVLGKRPSRLGYVAAVAGLTGTALAKTAQWWVSAIDYPLNIGGSPLFSYPAFVPVTFELMVLFSSLATVIGMLAVFNRLPQFGNSLLKSRFIRDLTCDKYGLVLDAADSRFDADAARPMFDGIKTVGFDLLYRQRQHPFFLQRIVSVPFLLLLAGVALFASSATRLVFRYGGAVPPYTFMKVQEKLNPQHESNSFPDRIGMRPAIAGTVPRGFLPYGYANDAEAAGRNLLNPVPLTAGSLARGRDRFDIFCQPCHGREADARGTLTAAFPKPPTLHSNKVRNWTDGRIYAVVTAGQNLMPSYASQVSREDRWQIIHYLRALQRAHNAEESDLK